MVPLGLGLIIGAILAREMGRQAHERGLNVHYPLLGITSMRARDIFGYTIMMLLLALPFFLVAITVVPYAGSFWSGIVPF